MEWKKPSIETTKHRYIVAVIKEEYEDCEVKEEMYILSFNGLSNRWHKKYEGTGDIMLKDIILWLPIPELPT